MGFYTVHLILQTMSKQGEKVNTNGIFIYLFVCLFVSKCALCKFTFLYGPDFQCSYKSISSIVSSHAELL